MKKNVPQFLQVFAKGLFVLLTSVHGVNGQITLKQDYTHTNPADIGVFQGINFKEGGFSALFPIAGTNGKEFWTISDRGVNVDAANANDAACRPTYDKIYAFPSYVPKIHRIRIQGSKIEVLQTITMKRPDGTGASGIINPTGFGSTAAEVASTDTVQNCANFNTKIAPKDVWGIDSEGLAVDKDGNFWIAEEGGPTVWKLNRNGVVVKRYTPYANLTGAETIDVAIDTVFKFRKNNRGFEGLTITPNGKVYAIIQSPILYPSKSVGEATRIHRLLEIDPTTDQSKMFAYLNDGPVGTGSNQIRFRDWKIGDLAAVNDSVLLVLEAGLRGTTDRKFVYKINISQATPVTSGLYGGTTLEALVDQAGLTANAIVPVKKTLVMDLLANGWPAVLEKAEGIAIINDSTLAINNDNDFGQSSPAENGVATANGIISHLFIYDLKGVNKLTNFVEPTAPITYGVTGPSTFISPYLQPTQDKVKFTSILTAGETVANYTMAGLGDGMGAFDNNDGTFTLLINHEMGNTAGAVHAHGQKGAFVSSWKIKKEDLTVIGGADLIRDVNLWNGTGYEKFNTANPSINAAMGRFCSADLPEVNAFYNPKTGLGTTTRIFMNGEETGAEGRGFAHIASGSEIGNSFELPRLGKYSYENAVACPSSDDKTVVIGLDDATPGQVYVYVGNKQATGNDVERAGLTNGKLYGVAVAGLAAETSANVPNSNTAFTLADLGNVEAKTGATLNTESNNAGVTAFLRPEDGAWDPSSPADFYFVTTNSFNSPSRMWRLRFTDVKNPELGGTITAVLDGTEGQKMMDNLTIDNAGHILIQEDCGNVSRLGRTWQYTIDSDQMLEIGTHNPALFLTGATDFLTEDEEATGIIDVQEILGEGMFLLYDQAHYNITSDVVQGGQLLAMYNPSSADSAAAIVSNPVNTSVCQNKDIELSITASQATNFQWQVLNGTVYENLVNNANYAQVNTPKLLVKAASLDLNGKQYRCLASRMTGLKAASESATLTVKPSSTSTTPKTVCSSDLPFLWNGGSYSTAGTYVKTLAAKNGCDSIATLNLSIESIAVEAIYANGVLKATQGGATYKWMNCTTNQVISGQTAQTFKPTADGSYKVIVTKGSCSDTSVCVAVSTVGINELEAQAMDVILFPNPTSDAATLKVNVATPQELTISIIDALGRFVSENQVVEANTGLNEFMVPTAKLNEGVYFVQLTNRAKSSVATVRMVVKH